MTLQAALVLIPAGVALYSGVYHLFLHSKLRRAAGHLPFALACITIAFYDIFAAAVYTCTSPEQAGIWQRNQFIALSLLGTLIIWFLLEFIEKTSRILNTFFIASFSAQTVFLLLDRSELSFTGESFVKRVMLFGEQVAIYNEMKPGIMITVQGILGIMAITYIFICLFRSLIKQPDSPSAAMITGFLFIFLAMVSDSLVSNGVYQFFYLLEYSFMFLGVSMAYALACRHMGLEKEVALNEEKLRNIVNSVPDIIYALDQNGLFISISDAASTLLGYPASKLIGRHCLEFVHPDDKRLLTEDQEKAIAARQGQRSQGIHFRLLNCDGEPVWVSLNSRMVYDAHGNFIREHGVIRDIRMVKGYQDELQKLAAAVNQADESIIITDRKGIIEYVNPCFENMTGYTRNEVIGKNTSILKSGKHSDRFYEELWSTLHSGKTWRGRFTNRKKDGTLFDENAVISPVTNEDGKILHFVAVKRDITQEVALESQLRESQKMEAIGRLAGGIAHDFTNSLVIILNSAQMAKKRIPAEMVQVHELLDNVVAASEKTSSLTSQLLAFSHSQKISPRVMNLNKVIAGVDTMIQRMMGSKTNLRIMPSPKAMFVKIDPSQIEQILIHLSVNANDAMPNGGSLTITTSTVRLTKDDAIQIKTAHLAKDTVFGNMAVISVTDTGVGMPKDIQTHAFEPFFTTKGRAKSTGLGLSTVYAIAQKHGGCVDLYSIPGLGTNFRVYLPLTDTADTSGQATLELSKGSERIMVVEDNMAFRHVLVQQLKSLGYSVLEVDDPITALHIFQKNSSTISAVLSDLNMPHMNGSEMAKEMLKIKPSIRIIYASAYPHEHLLEMKMLDPKDIVLEKPFSLPQVALIVRQCLDS